MSEFRRNIKDSQRFEYGIYQLLDHFIGRERVFRIFGKRRRRFYKKLTQTLRESGEGRIIPMERRKDLSLKEFRNHYLRKGIPVILDGGAKDWDCVKNWSFDYFKELYGDDEALMGTQENMGKFEVSTLREVIENIQSGGGKYFRFYPFLYKHPERIKDVDYKWLRKRINKISFFDCFQVFIGAKGGGSYLHNANPPNLFIQIWGEKDWILYPQYYTMVIDPNPVRNIYRNAPNRKDGKPFDPFEAGDYSPPYELFKYIDGYSAHLKPGDILWNPPHYWHAIKNPTDAIGMGYRWAAPLYALKLTPLYMFLDICATHPPIWKYYQLLKKDSNLIHIAEAGKLNDYLKHQKSLQILRLTK
jgi:hypothetical protein